MDKNKKLIIVGDSSFAEIAYEYFTYDSPYEVVAFSVEKKYLNKNILMGLPIVPFEDLTKLFDPDDYSVFVAIVYTQLNRLRTRLYTESKKLGYAMASYVSSNAFIWRNVAIGEHCFIFENNVLQPFVTLGDNNILWSGNHIGHHSTIGNNCFIASHVVISGHCHIGHQCFFGVNSGTADRVFIADDTVVGAGATVFKNTAKSSVYKSLTTSLAAINSYQVFKVNFEGLVNELE